ncbi:MAG: DUF853 family protein [Clostridia bacterium]|nr:DUF853 family protein [Clostridia bacterium]
MIRDSKIWIANNAHGEPVCIIPKMANRHGLIAGATGTGKTVTLKVMAESFSRMGVPVFIADVKGDVAGMMLPGQDSEDMRKRIERFGLSDYGFAFEGSPVTFWDIYGQNGIQLRTTVSEMGPLLLSRILGLNALQSDILTVIFKIADDNNLLLVDTKDLKALINFVEEHAKELAPEYGKMSSASIGVIMRAIVALEAEGADRFFGEPALKIADWLVREPDGKGMINILDSSSLINNGRLYSTFLLWMLSELFETLPEVGDLDRPKLVFFFDEAHLLFSGATKALLDKIEQVVKLIRSKGVGVYFCTQNPRDVPDGVLAQLGNKVEHGLRAYTPNDQKAVKAAADSFRVNPEFSTYDALLNLGTGEAVISFLGEDGIPQMAQLCKVLPPQCSMGTIDPTARDTSIKASLLYTKYAEPVDPFSAYEFLKRRGFEEQQAREEVEKQEAAQKEEEKELAAAEKIKQRLAEKEEKEKEKEKQQKTAAARRAAKSVGSTVVGSVGREVGKTVGSAFGKTGKRIGGNVGASLGRGLFSTLFRTK